MHLGMSGWFHVAPTGDRSREADPHDHVDLRDVVGPARWCSTIRGALASWISPRAISSRDYPSLRVMGPEPLSPELRCRVARARLRGKRIALKVALLDQRIVAGLGNIYASEALHHARLSPLRKAATIATAAGKPTPATARLVSGHQGGAERRRSGVASRRTARRASASTSAKASTCLRPGCGGTIRRITQAGRSTFYCPTCQR